MNDTPTLPSLNKLTNNNNNNNNNKGEEYGVWQRYSHSSYY